MYTFFKSINLKTNIEKLFKFHLDTRNLRLISPRYLRANVIFMSHTPLQKGSVVKVKLNVFPFVNVNWEVLIEEFEDNKLIVDLQIKGPFKYWKHKHLFQEMFDKTVTMTDELTYDIGFGLIGKLIAPILNWQIKRIFDIRHQNIELLFGG